MTVWIISVCSSGCAGRHSPAATGGVRVPWVHRAIEGATSGSTGDPCKTTTEDARATPAACSAAPPPPRRKAARRQDAARLAVAYLRLCRSATARRGRRSSPPAARQTGAPELQWPPASALEPRRGSTRPEANADIHRPHRVGRLHADRHIEHPAAASARRSALPTAARSPLTSSCPTAVGLREPPPLTLETPKAEPDATRLELLAVLGRVAVAVERVDAHGLGKRSSKAWKRVAAQI